MKEIWKDVVGWEGLYKVSNLGRILCCEKKTRNNHTLPERIKYLQIKKIGNLRYFGTTFHDAYTGRVQNVLAHRVVAEAFLSNVDNKPCIDHINGNGLDNRVANLRWCTHKENVNYPLSLKHRSEALKIAQNKPEAIRHKIESSHKKRVVQMTKEGEFVKEFMSLHEVGRELMLGRGIANVTACCHGRKHSAYGFIWKYID